MDVKSFVAPHDSK